MTSPFARFAPLNDLVRRQGVPLVSRTIIGGVALLDWDLQQTARFGAETWQPIGRTTEDIDIVIAAADDRGWFEALADSGWPVQESTARETRDPAAPDPARLARPERLRAFGNASGSGVGADGDAGPDRR